MIFLIEYPPSWNRLYRIARNRFYKHKDYVLWQQKAIADVWSQIGKPVQTEAPVKVTARVGRPDKRKRDLDNVLKALGDLLPEIGIIENDHQVHEWNVFWADDVTNGVVVEIEELLQSEPLSDSPAHAHCN